MVGSGGLDGGLGWARWWARGASGRISPPRASHDLLIIVPAAGSCFSKFVGACGGLLFFCSAPVIGFMPSAIVVVTAAIRLEPIGTYGRIKSILGFGGLDPIFRFFGVFYVDCALFRPKRSKWVR